MQIAVKTTTKTLPKENLLLLVPSNSKDFQASALKNIHAKLPELYKNISKEEGFKGEAGHHIIYPGISGISGLKRIILVGVGELKKGEELSSLGRHIESAMRMLPRHHVEDVCMPLDVYSFSEGMEEAGEQLGSHALIGGYQFLTYKKKNKDKVKTLKNLIFLSGVKKTVTDFGKGLKKGKILNEYISLARDLINEPSHVASPKHVVSLGKAKAKKLGMKCTVFTPAQVKQKGMGLLYAVGQGSVEGPHMLRLEYNGKPSSKDKYVMVGKGVTFDTGGVSLKPSAYMRQMKVDMTGSACVFAAICNAAAMKLPLNVIAYLPLAENAIGSKAFKPDDIVTAYNGLTVEIENTDAEGRLILADALAYASKHDKPTEMIDIGTLTGAAIFVTAGEAAPIMGTSQKVVDDLVAASKQVNEPVWQLPLWDCFDKYVKSKIADVTNLYPGKGPGTIACAAFLKQFVDKKVPWVHIDIAGVTLLEEQVGSGAHGPSGFGVRLLTKWLENKC